MASLIMRRPLYKKALDGEINNIVGVDIPFPHPQSPDLVVETEDSFSQIDYFVQLILKNTGLTP